MNEIDIYLHRTPEYWSRLIERCADRGHIARDAAESLLKELRDQTGFQKETFIMKKIMIVVVSLMCAGLSWGLAVTPIGLDATILPASAVHQQTKDAARDAAKRDKMELKCYAHSAIAAASSDGHFQVSLLIGSYDDASVRELRRTLVAAGYKVSFARGLVTELIVSWGK